MGHLIKPMGQLDQHFSVVQFFSDGHWSYVRRELPPEDAVHLAKRVTEGPLARTGDVARVIITDDSDFCVFEWQYGQGVTFPPTTQEMPMKR